MSYQNTILKIGDWIKAKSRSGELIIGYVESQSSEIQKGEVKVTVVRSDHNETVGKTILLSSRQVKSLPVSNVTNKAQIQFLIDLALLTKDKTWFMELTSELNSMNQLIQEEA
ncbi:IDEAL domain-containing protein [Bacillus sp. BRMEA1]|uniref:IDEAL domain-containing protein n=1 Tax=Neobacillus endophyticus TaxID=2738405 RepID=UPI001564E44A|nr:IDEAL domain-containing protein [Neobacillus endophyticus]NRD79996.1 IDEAL domain-containing protein [Neobacillus endophyticus]